MVNEYPTAGKPAVVLDAGGRVCAVARMDAKAFRKSLESGELWVLREGRVLPLEATRGMTARVSETDGWYEARLETVLSPAAEPAARSRRRLRLSGGPPPPARCTTWSSSLASGAAPCRRVPTPATCFVKAPPRSARNSAKRRSR